MVYVNHVAVYIDHVTVYKNHVVVYKNIRSNKKIAGKVSDVEKRA